MFNCKVCLKDHNSEMAAASDKNMCRTCYKEVARYRRIHNKSAKQPYEQVFVSRMARQFERNKAAGLYVPREYDQPLAPRLCVMCNETFLAPGGRNCCEVCIKREAAYRALLRLDKSSKQLIKHEAYYASMYNAGHKVPKPWLVRHGYEV